MCDSLDIVILTLVDGQPAKWSSSNEIIYYRGVWSSQLISEYLLEAIIIMPYMGRAGLCSNHNIQYCEMQSENHYFPVCIPMLHFNLKLFNTKICTQEL